MTEQPQNHPSCGARRMGKDRWVVEAWRCTSCQRLELFTREQA